MLRVGKVKFTPGWNFFWDTRTFQLGLKTEIFHPEVKWIFRPYASSAWYAMFSFYKNTDNRSVISYKLEKNKIPVVIDFL